MIKSSEILFPPDVVDSEIQAMFTQAQYLAISWSCQVM